MGTALAGKVALVAGATRGAGRGIAVQLGAAGATVYVTGRSSGSQRSEMDRPETIERPLLWWTPPAVEGSRSRSTISSTPGLRLHTLRLAVDTHAFTSHFAIPLLIKTPGGLVV
ncbi:MAG: hypothetical protein ACR2JK_02075 [Geodermatophilaceae bacterium]